MFSLVSLQLMDKTLVFAFDKRLRWILVANHRYPSQELLVCLLMILVDYHDPIKMHKKNLFSIEII